MIPVVVFCDVKSSIVVGERGVKLSYKLSCVIANRYSLESYSLVGNLT